MWKKLKNVSGNMIEKFEDMCKEFGGQYYREKKFASEIEVCEFYDFDDYEAFIRWLNKQEVKDPKSYVAKWKFGEGSYTYTSQFDVCRGGKELSYETEKSLMSADMLSEILREKGKEEVDMVKVFDKSMDKVEKEIEKIEPPYLRRHTDIEIGFDPDYDYYYAKAESLMNNPASPKDVLEDMGEVTNKLVDIAEDVFNEELDKEIG